MTEALYLVLIIAIAGIGAWAVCGLPIPEGFKRLGVAVILIGTLIYLANALGFAHWPGRH